MQFYKVKLNEGHTAKPDQNIKGYLASFPNQLGIYTHRDAILKAKKFGGSVEPHGKNYTVSESKMIQLAKQELSPAVQRELNGRELYEDTSSTFNEPIYFADVFATILGEETEKEKLLQKHGESLIEELIVLDYICAKYDYVRIM